MIYDHIVKINGKYYDAGENVPIQENKNITLKEDNSNSEMNENDLPFSDNDIELEEEPARRGRPRKTEM